MRNPIQPSPERPIPLPDCILLDSWWADLRDEFEGRPSPASKPMPTETVPKAPELRLRRAVARD